MNNTGNVRFFEKDSFISALFGISVLVIVFGFAVAWIDWNGGHADWQNPGIKGDYWGGHIGSVANLAAFIILVAATLLQRKELMESRFANQKIAEESENQARALEKQIEISRSTQSHSNFFQLLSFLDNSEKAVSNKTDSGVVTGRFFVRQCAERVTQKQSDQDFFRSRFYEMAQFFSWIQTVWASIENSGHEKDYFSSIFFGKFDETYLRDIKAIMDYYNMPNYNLQTIAPKLYDKLLHRFGSRP